MTVIEGLAFSTYQHAKGDYAPPYISVDPRQSGEQLAVQRHQRHFDRNEKCVEAHLASNKELQHRYSIVLHRGVRFSLSLQNCIRSVYRWRNDMVTSP